MRVISGLYRGRKLDTLKGDNTRPTTDRVKESMFNLIMFYIDNSKVLDLFSGSGSLGIECLSRGAKSVDFNDNNKESINIIKKNLQNMKGEYKIYSTDYKSLISKKANSLYDLIFIDPPYNFNIESELLASFVRLDILKTDGIIVYETNRPIELNNDNYEIVKEKKYGITYVTILRRLS